MAIPATCIHWAKLEDRLVEKGTDWTENGPPTYEACKFNNGARFDALAENLTIANFTDGLNKNAGCIEFWTKLLFDETDPSYRAFFHIGAHGAGLLRFFARFNPVINGLDFTLQGNAATRTEVSTGAITWDINDIVHLAFVWDKDAGLGGGKRAAIYWNGVDISAIVAGRNADWTTWDYPVPNPFTYGNGPWGDCDSVLDNLKIWDYAKTDFSDRNTEGFAEAPATKKIRIYAIPEFVPPAPVPVLFAPIRPKVLIIGDVDIYAEKLVDSIGNITESRSFRKDKLTDNEIQIPVDNKSLYFSPENARSPFNGADWYFSQVKVWDQDNIKIWDGLLWDIIRTSRGRTAKLISRSIMSKIKNIKVVYESADWETGPEALINIFAAADPPITEYNAKTFQDSINILTDAGALLKLKVTAEDDLPLQSLVEKVAEYCAADAYSHLGKIRFKVWQKITGTGAISIVEKNVLKQAVTQSAMNEIINDFSIGYSGDEGTPATDLANGNLGGVSRSRYGTRSLPEFSTGDENEIVFKDKTTAVWIGEQYIRRTHRNIDTIPLPLIQSKYSVEGRLRNYIDLETIIGFTYSDEGFDEEIMEIFQFVRNNDKNIVDLVAFTRAS